MLFRSSKVVSYSTDGFDFFKESYKQTNIPAALYDKTLSNRVYQYEFAYVALQSEAFDLSSDKQITFYCSYLDSIDTKITKPLLVQDVHKDYVENVVDNYTELNFALDITFDNIVNGSRLSIDELDNIFPNKQFKEYKDNELLSFFLEDKAYVTLPEKEIKGCFDFFYNESNLVDGEIGYGLTLDKTGDETASIAAVGFALASYVIGVEHKYISFERGKEISLKTLQTITNNIAHYKGFLIYFCNQKTAKNTNSEYSTIDTSIFLMGAITAASYFKGELIKAVDDLVSRVDWE